MPETKDKVRYELGLVFLFFLTWGFVFLDRTSINVLFPVIQEDLNLTNFQIGQINMWTNIGYVVFAILFSYMADFTRNRKAWLIAAVLLTSFTTAISGVATSFIMLLLIRLLVGASEGPTLPLMMTLTAKASRKETFGRNAGFINTGVAVISSTLGPIILTQMLGFTSWRMTFFLVSIASFILGFILIKYIKVDDSEEIQPEKRENPLKGFIEVFKYRNIVIGMIISASALTSLWMLYTYAPIYIVQVMGIEMDRMGFIMSAMGLLTILWALLVPYVSDFFGRKSTLIFFSFIAILPPLGLYLFPNGWIGIILFVLFGGLVGGSTPIFMNIIPVETVPDRIAATSNAVVMASGDLVGASIMVAVAGALADIFGLPVVMIVGAVAALIMALLGFALIETRKKGERRTFGKKAV